MKKLLVSLLVAALLAGCAPIKTTNAGAVGVQRKQYALLSAKQVEGMAAQSYVATLKDADKKSKLNPNAQQTERVRAIANRLIAQTTVFRADAAKWKWEVNVQESPEVNAYCMPGGKIMVYTGLIEKLKATDDELAAVMGHEISHALREHGRERMSEAYAQQGLVLGIGLLASIFLDDPKAAQTSMGLASTVSSVAITLPHSREQEREADRIGLELSARAAYDPNAAITLWQKMAKEGGQKPPEFLSTHPADEARIADMKRLLPIVMPLYEAAKHS